MKTPQVVKIPCLGYEITADWHKGSEEIVVLILIGFDSERKRYNSLSQKIQQTSGGSVVIFDYSGHGESPLQLKDTSPAQHFLEVITVFDWMKKKYSKAKIVVMGSSYGGYLATQLTKYRKFGVLVLRVPAIYHPSDFYTLWRDMYSDLRRLAYLKDKEAVKKHPLLKPASEFSGKTLLVVHGKDEIIPKALTDIYADVFKPEIIIAKDFKHSVGDSNVSAERLNAYEQKIANWIAENSK